ncbi:MAG: TfuA-like protein [Myxococcaceae bacterium]
MSLYVFLGPSLPRAEAKTIARKAVFLPPARQGDIWKVLAKGARTVALIDGVFESTPSVWHHELIAALDAGVTLFGASSMGALRAAELWQQGMRGVGTVYRWLREGVIEDDAEVALLHADAEHGYRALTVPLVNVRYAAQEATRERILSTSQARKLVKEAEQIFYQERTWQRVAPSEKFAKWLRRRAPDLKAEDARECLRQAAAAQRAERGARGSGAKNRGLLSMTGAAEHSRPSSYVRQRRLLDNDSEKLAAFRARADADALAESGVMRLLLAGWARGMGLHAAPEEVAAFLPLLKRSGLDDAERRRHCEDLALARLMVEHAPRMVPDGPAFDEGLVFEARTRGLWR